MFSEQRINYARFHDIIIFDNTYRTNRFDLPFGIFTGVNNYGQSVCFAGALMNSETTESFTWLFNTFLQLINYQAPEVLLTEMILLFYLHTILPLKKLEQSTGYVNGI